MLKLTHLIVLVKIIIKQDQIKMLRIKLIRIMFIKIKMIIVNNLKRKIIMEYKKLNKKLNY